jgi:hypothetical protein
LKYDSLPRLDFKGVFCIGITDPPVAQLTYKNEHNSLIDSVLSTEITRIILFFY